MPVPPFWYPVVLTLQVAAAATLLATVAGVGLAYGLSRSSFGGKEWLDACLALSLVLPPTVLGYYLLVLLGRNGVLGGWLHETLGVSLVFTAPGAVVASAVVCFPLVFQSARTSFDAVDRNLEAAARTLGASEAGVFHGAPRLPGRVGERRRRGPPGHPRRSGSRARGDGPVHRTRAPSRVLREQVDGVPAPAAGEDRKGVGG